MKKISILFIAAMASMNLFAVGHNDGSNKANAIEFDWDAGHMQPAGTFWYRMALDPLYIYDEPNVDMQLLFTNLSNVVGDEAQMTITFPLYEESKNMTISARGTEVLTFSAELFIKMHQTDIYFIVTSDKTLRLNAGLTGFTPSIPADACLSSSLLDFEEGAMLVANDTTALDIDIYERPYDADLIIYFDNIESNPITIQYGLAADCPFTQISGYTMEIAANGRDSIVLKNNSSLLWNTEFWLFCTSTGHCLVRAKYALPTYTDKYCLVSYIDKDENWMSEEEITLHLPQAPEFEGFTFQKWVFVAGDVDDGLFIQAIYTANDLTDAPSVVVNPSNPAQKLIREGNVYVLKGEKLYSITGQKIK